MTCFYYKLMFSWYISQLDKDGSRNQRMQAPVLCLVRCRLRRPPRSPGAHFLVSAGWQGMPVLHAWHWLSRPSPDFLPPHFSWSRCKSHYSWGPSLALRRGGRPPKRILPRHLHIFFTIPITPGGIVNDWLWRAGREDGLFRFGFPPPTGKHLEAPWGWGLRLSCSGPLQCQHTSVDELLNNVKSSAF